MRTSAEESERRIGEGRLEMRIPLVQQVQRRHRDERALLRRLHSELRQVGLPSARREHDDSLASCSEPGGQRRLLMRVWRHFKRRHKGECLEGRGSVQERRALRPERFDQAPVVQGRQAEALHPIIPGGIVDPRFARRRGMQQQGATVERKRW